MTRRSHSKSLWDWSPIYKGLLFGNSPETNSQSCIGKLRVTYRRTLHEQKLLTSNSQHWSHLETQLFHLHIRSHCYYKFTLNFNVYIKVSLRNNVETRAWLVHCSRCLQQTLSYHNVCLDFSALTLCYPGLYNYLFLPWDSPVSPMMCSYISDLYSPDASNNLPLWSITPPKCL